jgi:hypothetical protein
MPTKYAAFGTHLEVGTAQVERATIATDAAALTGSGAGKITTTYPGVLAGTPLDTAVALLEGDTPSICASKMAAAMNAIEAITDVLKVYAVDIYLYIRCLSAAGGNEALLNIAYIDDGCEGLTTDAESDAVTAGVDHVEVASVTNIAGPGLGVDIEDVTTHDQVAAWEEGIATVLRSDEVTLDIVYDPADDTHDATATGGLAYRLKNRVLTHFDLLFMGGAVNWLFFGYVNGFVPGGLVGGVLTATVKVKVTEPPILE